MTPKLRAVTGLLFALTLASCLDTREPASLPTRPGNQHSVSVRGDHPKLCAALRGNGNLVLAHFDSLAALSEKLGPFDGLAGGSSATITSFVYESIVQNPVVWKCPGCTREQIGARVSLQLKTIREYLVVLGDTEEARALIGLKDLLDEVQQKSIAELLGSESRAKVAEGIARLRTVLESKDLGDLLNPELREMLSPLKLTDRGYLAREAFEAVRNTGAFSVNDRKIFFRPGVLNFPQLARKIGRIGNYYAGYGSFYDAAAVTAFLDRCASKAVGFTWPELRKKEPACVAEAHQLIETYRKQLLNRESRTYSRVQDKVGGSAHILVSTAILRGAERLQFEEGFHRFYNNQDFDKFDFNVFRNLKFGYWGEPADLGNLERKTRTQTDLKSIKTIALDSGPWETALAYSPAEPGLSRIRSISDHDWASAAGWSDLAPVRALRAIGCEKVYYVTRRGEEANFGRTVARTLGMTPDDERDLYSYDLPNASNRLALEEADGVWCTDWDRFKVGLEDELAADAYHATRLVKPKESSIPGCGLKRKRRD